MTKAFVQSGDTFKRLLLGGLVSAVLLACMVVVCGCSGETASSDTPKEDPSYQAVVVSDTLEERGVYCVQIVDGEPASGLFILTPPEDSKVDPESLKAGDLLDVYGSVGMTMSLPGLANCTSFELVGTVEGDAYAPFQQAWDEFPGKPAV